MNILKSNLAAKPFRGKLTVNQNKTEKKGRNVYGIKQFMESDKNFYSVENLENHKEYVFSRHYILTLKTREYNHSNRKEVMDLDPNCAEKN